LHIEEIIKKYEIILVLGKLNEDMRERFESKISQSQDSSILDSLTLLDWISQPDLAHIIPETDIAITRGSATTLAELTYRQSSIHLIIIPLPYAAENHQYWNAKEYEKL
jgi:UDP-N-acetylglucosamine:LPS N-acetylglucosamine transferase